MNKRVNECTYPERVSCRGCPYSYNPALSDGGCMLHFDPQAYKHEPGKLPVRVKPLPPGAVAVE